MISISKLSQFVSMTVGLSIFDQQGAYFRSHLLRSVIWWDLGIMPSLGVSTFPDTWMALIPLAFCKALKPWLIPPNLWAVKLCWLICPTIRSGIFLDLGHAFIFTFLLWVTYTIPFFFFCFALNPCLSTGVTILWDK